MAIIYPGCEAGQIIINNGVLSCSTGWVFKTSQEIINESSPLGMTLEKANELLVPFMLLLATVFAARVVFKILGNQFGRA